MTRQPERLRKNISLQDAEAILGPIVRMMHSYRNAYPNRPTTFLKAGASEDPKSRYRSGDDYWIPEGNVVAVTKGHSQNVEEALINILTEKGICSNAHTDVGQYPFETEDDVFYYIAEQRK